MQLLSPHAKPRVFKQNLETKSKKEDSHAYKQHNNDSGTSRESNHSNDDLVEVTQRRKNTTKNTTHVKE